MIEQINKLIDKRIKSFIKKLDLEKRIPAKALSGEVDGYVEVQLVGDQNNRTIKLLNKTGEEISEGDSLWVTYHGKLTSSNAVISQRNGVANPKGGGAGVYIETAAVVTEKQASTYLVSNEVINVDVNNKMKTYYGDPHNRIVVGGQLFVMVDSVKAADYSKPELWKDYLVDAKDALVSAVTFDYATPTDGKNTYATLESNSFLSSLSRQSGEDYPLGYQWKIQMSHYWVKADGTKSSSGSWSSGYLNITSAHPTQFGMIFIADTITANTTGVATSALGKYGSVRGRPVLVAYDKDGNFIDAYYSNGGNESNFHFISNEEYEYAINVTKRSEIEVSSE